MRGEATTTESIKDAERILGIEVRRNRDKRVVYLTMTAKIEEVCKKLSIDISKVRHTPMPRYGYLVSESDLEKLQNEEDKRLLTKKRFMIIYV